MAKKKKRDFSGMVYSTDPDFVPFEEELEEETVEPKNQDLRISLDKKTRGGKKVTLIEGFRGSEADIIALGKDLKQKCGTGGSVKDFEILLQGDFRLKASQMLKKLGFRFKFKGGQPPI